MPISNCCPTCLIKQLVLLFILSMFKNKGNSFCSLGPRNNPGLALITESWRILSESCSQLPALLLAISIKPFSGEQGPFENVRQQPEPPPLQHLQSLLEVQACPELHLPLVESAAVINREISSYIDIISTYKQLKLLCFCLRFYNGSPLSLRASPKAWAYCSRSCDNRPDLSYAKAFLFSFFLKKNSFPG